MEALGQPSAGSDEALAASDGGSTATETAHQGAPGNLEHVRRFVNSIDIESGADKLDTPEHAREWLHAEGLITSEEDVTEDARGQLIALREAIRVVLMANSGEPFDFTAAGVMNAAAEASTLTVRATEHGMRLVPTGGGVQAAIGRLLAIVYEAVADGRWERLKVCRSDACLWAFYDHSKNRSGRWCTMSVCGNRMKARVYRKRHATDPAPIPAAG